MARWTIYSKDGSPKAMTDGIFVGQRVMPELEYSGTWMGESFVTVTVKSPNPVDWQIGDYLIYREEKFVLNYDPTVVKKARRDTHGEGFIYESVKFNALQVEMGDVEFLDEVLSDNHIHYTSLPTFSFFAATVDDMADRIQANMNRYCEQNGIDVEYRWIILTTSLTRTRTRARASFTTQADKDTFEAEAIRRWNLYYNGEETNEEEKINQNVSISKTTVWGSLVQIYNVFGLHYITSGRTLVIGAAGQIAEHIFEYGKGNGLYEIERVADSEQQIITKLYAYGNNTNLPIRYYANINKQCFATIQQMQCHGHPTYGSVIDYLILDIQYSNAYFIGEQYAASEVEERRVVIRKGNDEYVGYAWGLHPFEPCPISFVHQSPPLPQSTFSEGDIIYFEEGINKDNWPSGFYSYINDSAILPDNLAVNHLMLPGFPIQSLKAWALENGGVENENGSITWKGYTAFLSDEPLAPYILSPNYTTLGVREASKTWDGSDDTEDIYPTIENTGDDIVVYAETIQDNGVFAEEDEIPNFHIIIPPLGEDVALDGLMSEGSASISMKTGYCGGRDFEVVNAVKVTTGWNLTLHRKLDESLQLYFPYSENAAKASTPEADAPYQIRGANIAGYEGDKFVILGIDMPPAYINASAEKLLEEALKFLAANDYTRYTYTPRVDEIYMARQHDSAIASIGTENVIKSLHDTLHEGDLMRFADTDLEIDGTIFIEQLRIKEYGNANIPTYEVTLRNEKTVGTIERLQQTVDSLTGNGGNGTVIGGGVSVAQTKSLVRQEGDRRYIRRDINEETNAELTANKFIAKESVKTDSIEERTAGEGVTMESEVTFSEDASFEGDIEASENSTATLPKVKSDWIESLDGEDLDTLFGKGFLMKMVGDKAHLFTDFLTVRMKAVFAELEIRKLSYVGGTFVLTPAGCVVSKVVPIDASGEEVDAANAVAFKCYMTSDDGTTATTNTFKVGDQAQCRTDNIESGVYQNVENKYYWRLVTAIGSDTDDDGRVMNFIVLSNRATETIEGNTYVGKDPSGDNDIPAEGDTVVGLGNQISPTERGNIIMLRTVADAGSDNAPSVSLYRGVGASPNPYSLTGKIIMDFSPRDGMKILSDYLTIRSLSGDEKPISDYLGIYVVECSTLLVSTESISNVTPTVLGMTINSTLYAVQIGEYLLRMGEETEEGTAIIKCSAALQSSQDKTYLSSGVLTAVNMKGSEVVSTIGSSSSGELQFAYSDIDPDCDRVRISLVIDGVEKATSSISIVYDGVDGKNAKFERFTDLGSWARVLVSDSNTTDGSGNPVHTSTIKLKYSLAALLELVDGDSSTPITSLTGYTLLASYIYNGQSQNITTQFSDGRIAATGEVDVKSAFSTLGKVISIALSRTAGGVTAELARLEIPIVIGEQEIYNRTNTMWESMYINDGGFSSVEQTAGAISLKVGELNTKLLATGINVTNGEIAMTADKFTLQNNRGEFVLGADANGNLRAINITVEGVINNEIIELEHYEDPVTHLPQDNLEDYFFKSTRTDQEEVYMFDPLAIGSVIDATLVDQLNGKNIHFVLPCLYYDGSYKLYGVRYLGKGPGGHATGRHYTFDEIRQCIGKKFYVMANGGRYNHFDFVCGVYDGSTVPGLFVNVQSGYFGLDKVNQGLQEWEDNPWEASRGKTIGSNNQTLGFYMFECKVGKYGNGYWIYWEYSRVAESYVYGDSMILGNEGDLPQDESDESSEE